jgi:riboflavin synthase
VFAGIIERMGAVVRIGPSPAGRGTGAVRLEIDAGDLLEGCPLGASIAINGVCLTLAAPAAFDVVPETLRITNLGALQPGDAVNLERSLRIGDRLDGHFVQGHVDGVGVVRHNGPQDGQWTLRVELPPTLLPFCVRKGSITIDGTSLTLVDVDEAKISMALIPTTIERTILGRRRTGERVNIETDILARLVVSRLDALLADAVPAPVISVDRLRAAGFVT